MLQPFAYVLLAENFFCTASQIETACFQSPAPLQLPIRSRLSLINGPMKATLLLFFNGKTLPEFFKSTILFSDASRAKSSLSFDMISVFARSSLTYRYGSSNNPNLYFASNTLRQAASISAIVILPCCNDCL